MSSDKTATSDTLSRQGRVVICFQRVTKQNKRMNIWRVAGVALMAGLALFLISLLFKLMLVAFVTILLVRVVGRQLAGRFYHRMGRVGGRETDIISIDNPTYRSATNWGGFERVVPIS